MKLAGLTADEVRERVARGQTNNISDHSSRRLIDILRANILTQFNALLSLLAIAVLSVGGGAINTLFFVAMVVNSCVGIFQELRAKRILDKLSILATPKILVIRDQKKQEIKIENVVKDDLIELRLGDQIVADGEILVNDELEVDESLLTGESDPIVKKIGDKILSGSIVVAGSGIMRAEKVGAESYSSKLVLEAKKFQRAHSELIAGTNKLLKIISWILIIIVPILIAGQLRVDSGDWRNAILHSIAAIVGMIPEGLVLLTSAAFMTASIQLARRKVLVQQMPAVETLARVDTLLLDKTGTLTEGKIRFEATIMIKNTEKSLSDLSNRDSNEAKFSKQKIDNILATIASRAESPTNNAILSALNKTKNVNFSREISFSSARKWSAIEVDNETFILGAPEVILNEKSQKKSLKHAQEIANQGKRVLALITSDKFPENGKITGKISHLATIVLSEKIRPSAAETLQFFAKQNVDIKIISGDSPLTVAAVARTVGLKNVEEFDARFLPKITDSDQHFFAQMTDMNRNRIIRKYSKKQATKMADISENKLSDDAKKFIEIVSKYNVFGRVQPEQKRQIAAALQSQKHVVAMTGDGVNDALALKKADLGIAMESGASATKSVAEIVLLDNDFSHLPRVLSEGRRVIANIERVANLFIIKNVYSLTLALAVTMFGMTYPYLPVQMTVISTLSIGIPAFFLALAPNEQLYRPGFLRRVLRFAIPIGIVSANAMMINYYLISNKGIGIDIAGTSVSIVAIMITMTVLVLLARPLRGWKLALILACATIFVTIVLTPTLAQYFQYNLSINTLPTTFLVGGIGILLVILIKKIDDQLAKRA